MKFLEKLSEVVGKYMGFIVLGVGALALFIPSSFTWVKPDYINPLLGMVMFGMGLTLKLEDFKIVFSHPKDVIIGCLAQFTIMPLLAFILVKVFNLSTELAIGVILVGTCPGGTSSNVITFLSKGDIALSVGMTGVSTVLAPFLTPLLTYVLAGESIEVNITAMFMSIVKVIIIPIILGFIANKLFSSFTEKLVKILPLISVIAIVCIAGSVVSANSAKLLDTSLVIIIVVVLHNLLGYAVGFSIGKILKLDIAKAKAVSIEVGMQNSGLATSLATTHFVNYPLATIPGAIFSVWHNISGAIVANVYARMKDKKEDSK